ncbi:MAG: FMN-binding negative transcriptional regulator [Rhodobacteraceae bacterium]|nr:FMN-binding negative transcriptional regulator [Paracoccaceae bacterium]
MHPNQVFHTADAAQNLGFARETGFGMLCTNGPTAPLTAHVPFILSDDGSTAELHLVRSNDIARAAKKPIAAQLLVTGPQSYISPDWYEAADHVPTWNYVAVRLTGMLHLRPATEMADLLARQSAVFEARLAPKSPWTADKMTDGIAEKLMHQIVPMRFVITAVDGTWKLGQNKPDQARAAAARHVAPHAPALADLMKR